MLALSVEGKAGKEGEEGVGRKVSLDPRTRGEVRRHTDAQRRASLLVRVLAMLWLCLRDN